MVMSEDFVFAGLVIVAKNLLQKVDQRAVVMVVAGGGGALSQCLATLIYSEALII